MSTGLNAFLLLAQLDSRGTICLESVHNGPRCYREGVPGLASSGQTAIMAAIQFSTNVHAMVE